MSEALLQHAPGKSAAQPAPSFTASRGGLLQRKCSCGGTPGPTGECEACCEKKLQRYSGYLPAPSIINHQPSNASQVPPIGQEVLRSPSQPLDPTTRSFMEPRLGHDFNQVRVHANSRANESARAVRAVAYTVGRNIVFGEGEYAPATSTGQELLAHELTHVMQQSSPDRPQLISQVSRPSDAAEVEADQIAKAVTNRALSLGIAPSGRGLRPGLDKGSYESPRIVASPAMIYRQLSPLASSTLRAARMLRAGSVINNSNKPVTVWRDDFGLPYTIAAGAKSKPDEDVDHIKDEQGQWYKIGWNTVTVDATGKVDGYKCKVPTYNMDCPTPEKRDRPLTPAVSTGVASQVKPEGLLKR